MDTIGIGLIGTGFMGECHALAYGAVKAVFGDVPGPRLEMLCDQPAGKAQPMALTLDQARTMADVAAGAETRTVVGYNYIHNPAFIHAQKLIRDGAIGRVVHFRGFVDEDYQADPDVGDRGRAGGRLSMRMYRKQCHGRGVRT